MCIRDRYSSAHLTFGSVTRKNICQPEAPSTRAASSCSCPWACISGISSRAMGEFGAVSVVSGHIRGTTNTMPLHIEILYNEYQFAAAFAVASLLAGLALVTLVLKYLVEQRVKAQKREAEGRSE